MTKEELLKKIPTVDILDRYIEQGADREVIEDFAKRFAQAMLWAIRTIKEKELLEQKASEKNTN